MKKHPNLYSQNNSKASYSLFYKFFILAFVLLVFNPINVNAAITYNYCDGGSPQVCLTSEEYFFSDQASALQACQTWTDQFKNVDGCGGNGGTRGTLHFYEVGWGHLYPPNLERDSYFGKFFYGQCPDGTTPDPEKGCPYYDEPRSCPVETGNPINTATGSKYHDETVVIDSDLLDIELNYTSRSVHTKYSDVLRTNLSPGWDYSFNYTLSLVKTENSEEYVILTGIDSRMIRFNKVGNEWKSDLFSKLELTETSGNWALKTNDKKVIFKKHYSTDAGYIAKEIEYLNGKKLYLSHNGNGYEQITNDFGQFISLDYSVSNGGIFLRYATYSDGRIWEFKYDNVGLNATHNLISISYPDNTIKEFHYEDSNHPYALTGITSRHPVGQIGNRFATYEYDTERRVVKEWHHAKDLQGNDIKVEELTIVYNNDNTRTITNSRGEVSTYEVENNNGLWQIKSITGPGCSSCSNDNTDFVHDADNNLISKTQDGVTT